MYRTDKQFMKNPATASSRIYVGSLNKTVIAEDLEKVFSAHGKILGLSLNAGFAFIQYEHESEAQDAIKQENGKLLGGRKMIVRPSFTGNQGGQRGGGNQRGGGHVVSNAPPNRPMQESPQKQLEPAPAAPKPLLSTPAVPPPMDLPQPSLPKKNNMEEFTEDIMEDDRPNIRPPPGGPSRHNEQQRGGGGRMGRNQGPPRPRGRSNDRDRFGRYEPPPPEYLEPPHYRHDEPDFPPPPMRNDPYGPPPPIIEPPPPLIEKNDCEIIVVSKALTEYAEYIESKLKNLGLIVDLLFPNEDVPIGKVLANISSRGCLYAIMVMPINEEHRSLTLNILHTSPQEHRNMPIEDAMILISRDFESYMKGEHSEKGAMSVLDRHPVAIQMLLNLLAENRQLTSIQYDKVIKYLQDKRELQREFEIAEGITPESQDGADSKQTELQNRIMNILNKKTTSDPSIPTSITAPDPPSSKNDAPILKDPTVQKALDSILLGDMFKNIASSI